MRGLYAVTGVLILFIQLLPLETVPRGWVAPDFILCITMVWVARRPDLAPVWLIAAMFLLTDLLLQRPPGLWSALALVATEVLRTRTSDLKDTTFAFEWALVSAIIVCFYLALTVAWALLVPFEISRSLLALQMIFTILIYPAMAALSAAVFQVSKAAPGQTDALGRKL
ncbi:MAG: rod shape-determining protein MreD [Pseudomonadota bacterium]